MSADRTRQVKVAIVHDWLVDYAGADRVIDQMHQIYPQAPIYTLVYNAKKMPKWFRTYDIRTTFMQKIPFASRLYKTMLTMMPRAFESLDLTEFDLIISSCSSCSKGVITRPDALHICYCHTPTRYVWDFYYEYLKNSGWIKRKLIQVLIHKMRIWDRLAADRVDVFVGNSKFVAQRIAKYYRRDAVVIYPGVHINDYEIIDTPDDYYLMVGRFVHYKRFDLGIMACTQLGRRLIVVGGGDEEKKLHAMAGDTVVFVGKLSDKEIMKLYQNAKAFIFPGIEDFGITPVEAQSAGCPVIALGQGGAKETVLDGKTGLFFDEQSVESTVAAIERFEKEGVLFSRQEIRQHSMQFSEERFRENFAAFCKDAYKTWRIQLKSN